MALSVSIFLGRLSLGWTSVFGVNGDCVLDAVLAGA